MTKKICCIMLLVFCLLLIGCAGPIVEPMTMATLGYKTKSHEELLKLPPPRGKIIVAVYKFGDQTGQYKTNATSTSFSTAVTQGGTSMLLESLADTGWFLPVEREGLNNLLTERKIIMAKLKAEGKEKALPKLLHAPILLEGGIISYETNVSTGGMGARYLGIGGSTQFQKDQVGLYLRAVDVRRGEVLLSVSTTKSILSQEIQFGVFKFVDTDKILEGELGYTRNEPPQMCVLEAMDKAVLSLIIEGILDHRWELENPEDIRNPVIQRYLEEKGVKDPEAVFTSYLAEVRRTPKDLLFSYEMDLPEQLEQEMADPVPTVATGGMIKLSRVGMQPLLNTAPLTPVPVASFAGEANTLSGSEQELQGEIVRLKTDKKKLILSNALMSLSSSISVGDDDHGV